jgi:hypothetical protein
VADRTTDIDVAEKFFGWQRWRYNIPEPQQLAFLRPPDWDRSIELFNLDIVERAHELPLYSDAARDVPRYSGDIAAAWLIVEELNRRDRRVAINMHPKFLLVWVGNDSSLSGATLPEVLCALALREGKA